MPPSTNANGLKCVGSSGIAFCKTIQECHDAQPPAKRRRVGGNGDYSNFFRQAHFSADGTTIITHSEDECLRTFILPPDLLDDLETPTHLEAYAERQSPTNTLSYSLYPFFDLQNPSTTLVLSAEKDVPLSLRNVLHYETQHASYPLIDTATEAFLTPHSLAWTPDGTHFIAGSKDQLSVFDASRDGEGPISTRRTAPGRTAKKRYAAQDINSCKGVVSALQMGPDGLMAAGTLDRNIALFDHNGLGECVTAFSLPLPRDSSTRRDGTGVTHLRWSPCGKYLLIAERQSDIIHIYDVRDTHRRVGWLSGRHADMTQKLGIDVVPTADGFEVWAGGTNGCVRMWEGVGMREGEQSFQKEMKLHDGKFFPSGQKLEYMRLLTTGRSGVERDMASRWRGACYVLWT